MHIIDQIKENRVSEVKEFFEKGGVVELRDHEVNPLSYAIMYGSIEMIKVVEENTIYKNMLDHESWTPLHWAARTGDIRKLVCIMSLGYDKDINSVSIEDETPIKIAIKCGHLAAATYLKKRMVKNI